MRIVIILIFLTILLVLGFVAWLTGGSLPAMVAGVFLLVFGGAVLAARAKILTLPAMVQTLLGYAALLCILVIIWAALANWWAGKKAKIVAEAEKAKITKPTQKLLAECEVTKAVGCRLPVAYRQKITTGGQPVMVKFAGKSEWFRLSGQEDERLTLSQFNPGVAEFRLPDEAPKDAPAVLVRIYPVR